MQIFGVLTLDTFFYMVEVFYKGIGYQENGADSSLQVIVTTAALLCTSWEPRALTVSTPHPMGTFSIELIVLSPGSSSYWK